MIATFVRHIELKLILNASVTKAILRITLQTVESATVIVSSAPLPELINVMSVNLIEN
jgi:hypothetical protein